VERLFEVPAPEGIDGAYFLKLTLTESGKELTNNIYWLTTKEKDYTSLSELPKTTPDIRISISKQNDNYTGTVSLTAKEHISFFNRIKVFDKRSGKRILPVHYSDNYITLMPGDEQTVTLEFTSPLPKDQIDIRIESWTAE
jgi:hypothetical protein